MRPQTTPGTGSGSIDAGCYPGAGAGTSRKALPRRIGSDTAGGSSSDWRNSTGRGGVELLPISWLLAAVGADGPANLKGVPAGFTDAAEEFTAIGAMPIL